MPLVIFTGLDIEEIPRLRKVPAGVRSRFIERILTPLERTAGDLDEQTMVGLFCAKEAVSKALGCGIGLISWQEIEIIKDELQAPMVHLNGRAAELAQAKGIHTWSISISHTREYAAAVAVGYGE